MRRSLPLLAAVFMLTIPAAARAATVEVVGSEIVVTAGPEANDIGVGSFEGSNDLRFRDSRSPVTAGAGCEAEDANSVLCKFPEAPPTRVRATLGPGSDGMDHSPGTMVPATIDGGEGNDNISGGGGGDALIGGPGDDTMTGDERFRDSSFAPMRGADDFSGGDGVDVVSYFAHKSNGFLGVSLDDQPNDGESGEGDNVRSDVENLEGDISANNSFVGSDGPNELLGSNSGNDAFEGRGGNDRLLGFDGNDRLDGGDGDDYLEGGFGDDYLEGAGGLDSYIGDRTERNVAGTGNDSIRARDGIAEPIACGPGADNALIDATDTVAADGDNLCEQIYRPEDGGGGDDDGDGGFSSEPFPLSIPSKLVLSKSGRIKVKLRCRVTDPAGCNGTLRLATTKPLRVGKRRRYVTLGTRAFSIAPGGSARTTFKLSRKHRKALRRSKRVKVEARAVERAAQPRIAQRIVTVRRRR